MGRLTKKERRIWKRLCKKDLLVEDEITSYPLTREMLEKTYQDLQAQQEIGDLISTSSWLFKQHEETFKESNQDMGKAYKTRSRNPRGNQRYVE